MMNPLAYSDAELLDEARKLRVAYKLKQTLRYGSTRDAEVHTESVAEHVFGLILLAHYFLYHESVGPSLNAQKVFDILLFHDFPEIKHGGVVTYRKTAEDEEREREAAEEVFASLPEPLSRMGHEHWMVYEEHKTPEARFAYAIDKIEPLFELLDPVTERSIRRLKITFDMHVGNKYKAAADYPLMMRFTKVLSEDMKARGVFLEN